VLFTPGQIAFYLVVEK
jgi:hypothetical protein